MLCCSQKFVLVTSVVKVMLPLQKDEIQISQPTSIYFNRALWQESEGGREGNTLQADSRGRDAKEERQR